MKRGLKCGVFGFSVDFSRVGGIAVGVGVMVVSGVVLGQGGLPVSIEGPAGSGNFGSGVCAVGDMSGNGLADVVTIDPNFINGNGDRVVAIYAYRGLDGLALWSTETTRYNVTSGKNINVASIADVNGDGRDDVLFGQPEGSENGSTRTGLVKVFSGIDGALLLTVNGSENEDLLGYDVDSVKDVSGDGISDIVLIAKRAEAGKVSILSSVDGSVIREINVPWPRRLATIGDLNGDGKDEIIVGMYDLNSGVGADVIDSASGEIIKRYFPEESGRYGFHVGGGGDVNRDGVPDFMVIDEYSSRFYGVSYLYSGKTGQLLKKYSLHDRIDYGKITDINGDGRNEILLGINYAYPGSEVLYAFHPVDDVFFRKYDRVDDIADVNGDGLNDLISDCCNSVFIGSGSVLAITVNPTSGKIRLQGEVRFRSHRLSSRRNTMYVSGVIPGHRFWVLYSEAGDDCTFIPEVGMCISLTEPIKVLRTGIADAEGNATVLFLTKKDAPSGDRAWFQAVELHHGQLGAVGSEIQVGVVE